MLLDFVPKLELRGPLAPKTSSWKYSFKSVLVVVISSLQLSRQGKGGMPADV